MPLASLLTVHADDTLPDPVTKTVDLEVNVAEVLTISLDEPTSWASGATGSLLRNKVGVTASTNNRKGVTVSMYTKDEDIRLKNTDVYKSTDESTYIDTLGSNTTYGGFTNNAWGYSVTDTDTPTASATYLPMQNENNPIQLFSTVGTATTGEGSQTVFFGAKADSDKQSGTYAQTVYFVAVTDVIDDVDNPQVPVNPSEENPRNEIAQYNTSTGRTTYTTYTASGSTRTTETEVSAGNQANTYDSYVAAAGVTTNSGNTLPIALATAAAVAGTSGFFFFILAKRRKDDDEEEEQ